MYKKCVKICKLNNFHEPSYRNDPSQRLCKMSCNNSVTLIMNKILMFHSLAQIYLWGNKQNQSKVSDTKTSQKYQVIKTNHQFRVSLKPHVADCVKEQGKDWSGLSHKEGRIGEEYLCS